MQRIFVNLGLLSEGDGCSRQYEVRQLEQQRVQLLLILSGTIVMNPLHSAE
ncbi:hypothetical protein D3C75_1130610 [compost metagenome]